MPLELGLGILDAEDMAESRNSSSMEAITDVESLQQIRTQIIRCDQEPDHRPPPLEDHTRDHAPLHLLTFQRPVPELDEFAFLRDLWARTTVRSRGLRNEPVIIFETWFLSRHGFRRCSTSRQVAMDSDFQQWLPRLRHVWRDRVRPDRPTELVISSATAPFTTQGGGHLLLLQDVPAGMRGVLFSSYHDMAQMALHDRSAAIIPRRMSSLDVLAFHDLDVLQATGQIRCRIQINAQPLEDHEVWPIESGDHIEIFIQSALQLEMSEAIVFDTDDIVNLMQTCATTTVPNTHAVDIETDSGHCEGFSFNPAAPTFVPAAEQISNMPEVIQDLYAHWNRVAFAWEDEPRTAQLVTWFVDHGNRALRTCQHSRVLTLLPHFPVWEQQIRHVWHEFLQPGAPHEIHIVSPSPLNMATDIVAHVILIQNPHEDFCTSLITMFDDTAAGLGPHRQLALTTVDQIYLENLIHSMSLTERCLLSTSDVICEARYQQTSLNLGHPIPGRNGYGIHMQLRPRPPPAGATEGVQLLQLNALLVSGSDVRQTPGQVEHAVHLENADRPPTACTPPNPMSSRSQRPALRDQSAFVQRLFASCQLAVRSGDFEDHGILVSAFFVNHNDPHARCDNGRLVHLDAHFDTWEEVLREAWRDRLRPTQPLSYYIVSPQPFDMEEGLAAFVILVQDPQLHLATSLVSVYEIGHLRGRSAVTTLQTISHSELVHAMGFQQACIGPQAIFHCEFWTRDIRIQDADPYWSSSGLALYAQLQPIISSCERQTHGQVAHTHGPQVEFGDSSESVASETQIPFKLTWLQATHCSIDEIFMPQTATEHDFEQFLAELGHYVHVYFMGCAGQALCVPWTWKSIEDEIVYLYVAETCPEVAANFIHLAPTHLTELDHMRILHKAGYLRAVIVATKPLRNGLIKVSYHDNQPTLEELIYKTKPPNHWPPPLPQSSPRPLLDFSILQDTPAESLMRIDMNLIQRFFSSTDGVLCPWHDHLQLPDTTRAALSSTLLIDDWQNLDRLIIYTDGTSQVR